MRVKRDGTLTKIMQVVGCVTALSFMLIGAYNKSANVMAANNQKISEEVILEEKVPLGWTVSNGKTYYLDEEGNKVTGFQYIDNKFYLFYEDGTMHKGWITLNDRTFYFNEDGIMQTDECLIEGKLYKFMLTGDFLSGWYTIDDKVFYRDKYGYDQVGLVKDKNDLYFIDPKEGLLIGEITVDGITINTNPSGKIYTGECKIGNKKTLYSETGVFLSGWKLTDDKYTYINAEGVKLVGRQTIEGKEYFFDEEGYLKTDTVIGMYKADAEGVLTRLPVTVETLNAALDEILLKTGKDINAISDYVRGNLRYKYMDKKATREEMAVYALNNKRCSCYYYEALCGLLLERAGYEIITVKGVGFVYAEHYWSLCKTTRNGITGWYHVDSLKGMNVKTDAEMVAKGFKWTHADYPATP